MRRGVVIVALIGVLGVTAVAMAEGEQRPQGGMPPAIMAVKEKYRGLKEQLHKECQQKMQALDDAEHTEMKAAMQTSHDEHMKEMDERYQQHKQEMQKRFEEHQPQTAH